MNLPRVLTTWMVVGLLAGSWILVAKWVTLSTPVNQIQGLAKTVGTI